MKTLDKATLSTITGGLDWSALRRAIPNPLPSPFPSPFPSPTIPNPMPLPRPIPWLRPDRIWAAAGASTTSSAK